MSETLSPYLRVIGKIANTRHPGGLRASEFLLNKTDINKHWRVLDLGCGAGHTSAHIAQKYGCFVNGIDISSAALENATALYKNEPYANRLQFEKADLLQLPFSDSYFNAVLCESVLLFNANKEAALGEMKRVLKPGGFLVLNELCLDDIHQDKIRAYCARPEFGGYLCSTRSIEEMLRADGFDIKLQDQSPLNIFEQLKADLMQFGNMKGLYQLLELLHQVFTDHETRTDLWKLAKFIMDMPSGLKKLISLKLLAEKK